MKRRRETKLTKVLDRAKATHLARVAVYGDQGYRVHGAVMALLFPEGLTLRTADDFARFTVFENCVAKLCRYANQYTAGGHRDSIHDLGVYAFMLEVEDADHARTRHRR